MSDRPKELTLAEQAPANHECRACGYVYEPKKGDGKGNIPSGTPFEELPVSWRCPVCGVPKSQFVNVGAVDAPSGFADNLNYGFGVNRLTPGQKNLLIFGALALAFLFFLSLYGLS
ncbi:rubredoxin [Gloeothece verrucosa]|uniref:Rubredoxin n=1 Tax=Gloeothece verrucosa (strain PCC 7822) TaxID=497965 RepID=E0UC09_GLOV7|nr:rubredoxin [Gloeothece verrucosa]ADN16347.1 Rubredoxin-type Fe(Cys)4 protein [Gloeothece verrucosa PCC 7822]